MKYARIDQGAVIAYPYQLRELRTANPNVSFSGEPTADDLEPFGVVPVAASDRPSLLPGQQAVEAEPALIGDAWTQQWTVEGDLAAVKAAMLAALAERRWQAEEAGTTLGAMPLATDRVTQAKLTAVYFKAAAESDFTIPNWKVAPGVFVTLDATAILAAGDAVRAFVQLCFDNEASLAAEIEVAADFDALAAIDLETGWPE
jgi:hypothetical protein